MSWTKYVFCIPLPTFLQPCVELEIMQHEAIMTGTFDLLNRSGIFTPSLFNSHKLLFASQHQAVRQCSVNNVISFQLVNC